MIMPARTSTLESSLARVAFVTSLSGSLVLALGGCKSHDELETARQAMLATLTPCPTPATCTGKMEAADREVAICSPAIDAQAYAVGDIVAVKELKVHDTLGKVKAHEGKTYKIEFADGITLERDADKLVGRLCK